MKFLFKTIIYFKYNISSLFINLFLICVVCPTTTAAVIVPYLTTHKLFKEINHNNIDTNKCNKRFFNLSIIIPFRIIVTIFTITSVLTLKAIKIYL